MHSLGRKEEKYIECQFDTALSNLEHPIAFMYLRKSYVTKYRNSCQIVRDTAVREKVLLCGQFCVKKIVCRNALL